MADEELTPYDLIPDCQACRRGPLLRIGESWRCPDCSWLWFGAGAPLRNTFPRNRPDPHALRSPGTRLGRLLAAEAELAEEAVDAAGHEFICRFMTYLTGDGLDYGLMITRMERLKFQMIVTGKSIAAVLADMGKP